MSKKKGNRFDVLLDEGGASEEEEDSVPTPTPTNPKATNTKANKTTKSQQLASPASPQNLVITDYTSLVVVEGTPAGELSPDQQDDFQTVSRKKKKQPRTEDHKATLGTVEVEIVKDIFANLDGLDAMRLSRTCKRWRKAIEDTRIWLRAIRKDFPARYKVVLQKAEVVVDWKALYSIYRNHLLIKVMEDYEFEMKKRTTRSPKQGNFKRWAKGQMETYGQFATGSLFAYSNSPNPSLGCPCCDWV
eukprot:TRINITY_DN4861_c0_g3_i2.p2 TRINITY_DN4861_c0_g3~~TRINITY_DN4861_c0_g3_i2.p2  ORF type:complete len:246 (+),score=60.19 TRINITY_DN4861_c0_g3_i2:111-848(+)